MIGTSALVYEELNPANKDGVWADKIITNYRRMWRRLITVDRAFHDRALLYSVQELTDVKESFDDEDFKKRIKFLPLPILEPMLNSVVEDIIKSPPKTELKAIDPTATEERKQDIELLRNRKILENDRTNLQTSVGLPDYSVSPDKFKGNIGEFDRLGLDESQNEDVNFYEDNLQKLNHEIAGQSLLDIVFKNSRFDKITARKLVKDIFALKAITVQKYVDKITGEIKDKYIDPQNCFGVFGQTNDGTDDVCRGFLDPVTFMEFLQIVGNDFDFNRDWRYVLWAINYCNVRKFTGFIRNGITYDCCGNPQWMGEMGMGEITTPELLDWSLAYTFKIYLGYIEFRSPEATLTAITKKDNPNYVDFVPFSYELKKKQIKEGYEKTSKYQVPWYCSWFIATTSLSQWIFNYGKVYFQTSYGANDEYSNGTLCYYQEEGLSAVEIARPYLQAANFTFYRMLWTIYKAKPDPDEFVFEELLQLAGNIQRQFPQAATNAATPKLDTILMDLIKQMRQKHVRIRTYPRVEGRAIQQIYPIEQKGRGGLDPIAISMQAVTMWAEQQILSKVGINPMRLGQNPPSRESTKSEENAVNYSLSTTGYMYRMIQYLKEHLAVATLNYAQDIIKFKDSIPYNWLKKMIGTENLKYLQDLGDFAAHRYALFIDDYNSEIDKQDIKNAALVALQEGKIDFSQWFTITQTHDPKKSAKLLGHYELKKNKELQQQEAAKQQALSQMEKDKHDMAMAEIQETGKWEIAKANITARGVVAAAQIAAKGKIDVKELQTSAEPEKQQQKTQSQKELLQQKADIEEQKAFPMTEKAAQ